MQQPQFKSKARSFFGESALSTSEVQTDTIALVQQEICADEKGNINDLFCYFLPRKNLTLGAVITSFTTTMNMISLPHLSF